MAHDPPTKRVGIQSWISQVLFRHANHYTTLAHSSESLAETVNQRQPYLSQAFGIQRNGSCLYALLLSKCISFLLGLFVCYNSIPPFFQGVQSRVRNPLPL